MTKIYNFANKTALININLDETIRLTLERSIQDRTITAHKNFGPCQHFHFDKHYNAAMEEVIENLKANGSVTAKEIKNIRNVMQVIICALFNGVCEADDEACHAWFYREVNKKAPIVKAKKTNTKAVAKREHLLSDKFVVNFEGRTTINLIELVSYAIAIATNDKVYDKRMAYWMLKNAGIAHHLVSELSSDMIKAVKAVGNHAAKSLKRKGRMTEEQVQNTATAIYAVLTSAKDAFEQALKHTEHYEIVKEFDKQLHSKMSVWKQLNSGIEAASDPFNFHDFDDYR